MKKIILITYTLLTGFSYSQQVVVNQALLVQLTKNQAVRLSSNEAFLRSYTKQEELYGKIKQSINNVVLIQEYIYSQLTNINELISQGKQVKYLYTYIQDISIHGEEMFKLSAKKPQYAVLLNKYYIQIGKHVLAIEKELVSEILNKENDFLMDSFDRYKIISKLFERIRLINGTILYINMCLKNAHEIPYLYQIPGLENYVNHDRAIVQNIMMKLEIIKW